MTPTSDLKKLGSFLALVAMLALGFWGYSQKQKDRDAAAERRVRELQKLSALDAAQGEMYKKKSATTAHAPAQPEVPAVVHSFPASTLEDIRGKLSGVALARNQAEAALTEAVIASYSDATLMARIRQVGARLAGRRVQRVEDCLKFIAARMSVPLEPIERDLILALARDGAEAAVETVYPWPPRSRLPTGAVTAAQWEEAGKETPQERAGRYSASQIAAQIQAILDHADPKRFPPVPPAAAGIFKLNQQPYPLPYVLSLLEQSYLHELEGLLSEAPPVPETPRKLASGELPAGDSRKKPLPVGGKDKYPARKHYDAALADVNAAATVMEEFRSRTTDTNVRIDDTLKLLESRRTELKALRAGAGSF